jgi:hypothetical protein
MAVDCTQVYVRWNWQTEGMSFSRVKWMGGEHNRQKDPLKDVWFDPRLLVKFQKSRVRIL